MLIISKDTYDSIIEHAKKSYPHECCGVLLGSTADSKKVVRAKAVENINKQRAKDRYEIDPRELLAVEKEARREGLEVMGFYHSHPDHPPRPSKFDRERGWPEYSYIIVAVSGSGETELKSWTFHSEDEPFREEEVRIV